MDIRIEHGPHAHRFLLIDDELLVLPSVPVGSDPAVPHFVVLVGLSGMLVAIMTSLNERRREMAILRSVGARPLHVFSLIVGEAGFVTLVGIAVGVSALYVLLVVAQPLIASRFGLYIGITGFSFS